VEPNDGRLVQLSRDECLRLLATAPVGRVALSMGALPVVLPVNFVLDGESVVFRTGEGTKHEAAVSNTVVAFEVDQIDPLYHSGWSVLVTGVANVVTAPTEVTRLAALPLRPWADGQRGYYVRISGDRITGRRLWSERAYAADSMRD
jgi:nitroimidazol reductase NimA-like FMN-containing flavoprotein (pyridoxamine 5'-phosphate oxidase superfamily)